MRLADKDTNVRDFSDLSDDDRDLTMFTITNLVLEKDGHVVYMAFVLKRKIAKELLTTFLPTVLLLIITYMTTFFHQDLFSDSLAVNLTIMLVMTTIFTAKIEELPPTSDTKMIDIWLIACLLVPFTDVVLRTVIECLRGCECASCLGLGQDNEDEEKKEVKQAKAGQVAPQVRFIFKCRNNLFSIPRKS